MGFWIIVKNNKVERITFNPPHGQENCERNYPVWEKVEKFFQDFLKNKQIKGIPFELHHPPPENELRFYLFLQKIPPGQTISYGELSEKFFGSKKYSRYVGNLLARNRWPLLFPCHRVIRKDGSPGGFSGGIEIKRRLLNWEREGVS